MNPSQENKINSLRDRIFVSQLVMIVLLTTVISLTAFVIYYKDDMNNRDRTLKDAAEMLAHSQVLQNMSENSSYLLDYIDQIMSVTGQLDVISVVDKDLVRKYHTNHELIATRYTGSIPDFENQSYIAVDEDGPSGKQRRAYAAVYSEDGKYQGFIIAIQLRTTIRDSLMKSVIIFMFAAVFSIAVAARFSRNMADSIKIELGGYEPNVFSAMYKIRDDLLESLAEGIIATDVNADIHFMNEAAKKMLGDSTDNSWGRKLLGDVLKNGERQLYVSDNSLPNAAVFVDKLPIRENDRIIGAAAILHDRSAYTKLAEDLSGTRYLVDSMRANNHDFTNKLHVILGLLQMEMYDEAKDYIEHITMVQRETISRIMNTFDEPAVAALLIGKTARASELNVSFNLREDCSFRRSDITVPSEALVTIIGNLVDNALDAMNMPEDTSRDKELTFGMYSRPGALLITVDDNGCGIPEENADSVFEQGFSTKGQGRGTGLYHIKNLIENMGGQISFESQSGVGTSFMVSINTGKQD